MGEHQRKPKILAPEELEARIAQWSSQPDVDPAEVSSFLFELMQSHEMLRGQRDWLSQKKGNGVATPNAPPPAPQRLAVQVAVCLHGSYPGECRYRPGTLVTMNEHIHPRGFAGGTARIVASALALCRLVGPSRFESMRIQFEERGKLAELEAAHMGPCYWLEELRKPDGSLWYGQPPHEQAPPMIWAREEAVEPAIRLELAR